MTASFEERFWSKVHKTDGCWFWTGSKAPGGYGTVRVGRGVRMAAQVSWELFHGESFPEGMDSCHTCDTPGCVRPQHIWPGTALDNVRDCRSKGRQADFSGERNPRAKLTEQQVRDIRFRCLVEGVTQRSLAPEYGVSKSTIWYAVNGLTWRKVK